MNYFELFEIPMSLKIDKTKLAQQYFALQKKYHPDFFINETEKEQADALEASSQINKAFKVFKNEEETIKYVLQLKGVLGEGEKYQLPPGFLMEMMELNEALSENSQQQIERLEKEIYAPVKEITENFSDRTTKEELLLLKEYYFKKKYLHRILDRMEG
jgi:molecular chaperone HscB